MGVDYVARKAAKKRNKQARRADHKGDHNARKERLARGVPKKRLGVCWGQPVLTEDDRMDFDEDAGDASQHDVLCGAGLGTCHVDCNYCISLLSRIDVPLASRPCKASGAYLIIAFFMHNRCS